MSTALGTYGWLRETRGILSVGDRWALARQALRVQLALGASLAKRVTGLPAHALTVPMVEGLQPPDSAVARDAMDAVAAVSSPALLGHCMRAYLWGRMLAMQEGRAFDDELYFVATLYHDYGLTDAALDAPCQCFTQTSADAALAFAAGAGWNPARSRSLADIIALHINVGVFPADGSEAYLLHHATTMDCTGIRLWEFSRGVRHAVLARHPRGAFTREVDTAFQRELARCPGSRMQFLYRYLFFGTLMRFGPLKGD